MASLVQRSPCMVIPSGTFLPSSYHSQPFEGGMAVGPQPAHFHGDR